MLQNIRGEKSFQEQRRNRGNGRIRQELNHLAQYWALLNAVFGVWVIARESRLIALSNWQNQWSGSRYSDVGS